MNHVFSEKQTLSSYKRKNRGFIDFFSVVPSEMPVFRFPRRWKTKSAVTLSMATWKKAAKCLCNPIGRRMRGKFAILETNRKLSNGDCSNFYPDAFRKTPLKRVRWLWALYQIFPLAFSVTPRKSLNKDFLSSLVENTRVRVGGYMKRVFKAISISTLGRWIEEMFRHRLLWKSKQIT